MDEEDDAWSLPLPRLTEPQGTCLKEEDVACPALAGAVHPSLSDSLEKEEVPKEAKNVEDEGDQRQLEPMEDSAEEEEYRDKIGPLPRKKSLAPFCEWFRHLDPTVSKLVADVAAKRRLEFILAHYLESPQSTCDKLLLKVLNSPYCDQEHALLFLMAEMKESSWLRKLRAMKAMGLIADVIAFEETLEPWVPFVANALLLATCESNSRAKNRNEFKEELSHSINALLPRYMPDIEALLDVTRRGIRCQRSRREKTRAV
ncbi:uncharacterized protein LOC121936720 isoform X2 [Sceloporus undulatus]|uniref:uncharacterized protein LOC121936720 isoform X2 n=1 Tax=Sceloporus undulatus TaxID=8520 RepID=UPI001C4DC05E|nr:uncharacterized protein LOC121936720 isoform X2 [Sceloporus undulatus]